MRLYPISKKIGVLDKSTKKNLQDLITTMESKAKHEISPNGCCFTTTYTTGGILKETNNAVYGGKVCGIANNTSVVTLNDKNYIVNNLTGAVTPEETKLGNVIILSTKKLLAGIADVINKVKEHFDNSEVVKQYSWGISGVTPKGAERLQKIRDKIVAEKIAEREKS